MIQERVQLMANDARADGFFLVRWQVHPISRHRLNPNSLLISESPPG